MKIVLITGGFDPLHSGHIAYINSARELGDKLVVGLNSDDWLTRKKGRPFLPWVERAGIISNLHNVDRVINFNDDNGTAIDAIRKVKQIYPDQEILFANGGDRTKDNVPEMVFNDVEFVFGVGGDNKKNSSSWILQEWKSPKTERPWGYYRVLHEHDKSVKVKELTVEPGQRLSMQRHASRSEHWFVVEGTATVYTINVSSDLEQLGIFNQWDHIHIPCNDWHQLCNETVQPLKLIEIQYGSHCIEEDIERK